MELFFFKYHWNLSVKGGIDPSMFLKIHWYSLSKKMLFVDIMILLLMLGLHEGLFIFTQTCWPVLFSKISCSWAFNFDYIPSMSSVSLHRVHRWKLSRRCWSAIPQYKIKSFFRTVKKCVQIHVLSHHITENASLQERPPELHKF